MSAHAERPRFRRFSDDAFAAGELYRTFPVAAVIIAHRLTEPSRSFHAGLARRRRA